MLISVRELQVLWGVNPRTIVHVGAHNAEELDAYAQAGWGPVIWVEAQPQKVVDLLKRIPADHRVIEAAIWDVEGEKLDLKVMTNTESTSLLNLGTHTKEHPSVAFSHTIPVKTKTLKSILADTPAPELLSLDIQGVELRALKGYGDEISKVKWIYCEVNREELYQDCALISELDDYLGRYGFTRTATRWTIHKWGDALFENKSEVDSRSFLQSVRIKLILFLWRAMTPLDYLYLLKRRLSTS